MLPEIKKLRRYESSRKWALANPEKTRENSRKWRTANPEKAQAAQAKWRAANPEKTRAQARIRSRKRYAANPEKSREASRKWRAANPGHFRLPRYGLTPRAFEILKNLQCNACAICKKSFSTTPYVDHDHTTGKVRGLLCNTCNIGLGRFKDSPVHLRAAANYLEQS